MDVHWKKIYLDSPLNVNAMYIIATGINFYNFILGLNELIT